MLPPNLTRPAALLAFKSRSYGIVDSHLAEVSKAFPTAVFLLEYRDAQASYAGKRVIKAGEVLQEVFDGDQQVQGLDWALLDIFAPFRAEYHGEEHGFGSLWQPWLDAIIAAAKALKHEQGSTLPGSPDATRATERPSGWHLSVGGPGRGACRSAPSSNIHPSKILGSLIAQSARFLPLRQINRGVDVMAESRCSVDIVDGVWPCLIPDCSNPGRHRAPGGSERDWLCCEHLEQFVKHLLDPLRYPVFPLPLE